MARRAGQHLQQRMNEQQSAQEAAVPDDPGTLGVRSDAPQPRLAPRSQRLDDDVDPDELERIRIQKDLRLRAERRSAGRRRVRRLTLFTIVIVLIFGIAVYTTLEANGLLAPLVFDLTVPDAEPLPEEQAAFGALEGNLYNGRISDMTTFFVREPSGTPPPEGWPLLVGIHGSGGTGMDALFWGRRAPNEGVLMVAPTFTPIEIGGFEYDSEIIRRDLQAIMAELETRYPIDPDTRVLFGFSMGGLATSGYTTEYPDDFDGAAILGARSFYDVPSSSNVRYVVITGNQDERAPAAEAFIAEMEERGSPLWYAEIEPDVGHEMSDHMIDKTFELLDSLR